MRLLILLLVVVAGLDPANACPPGPCLKYRRAPPTPEVDLYHRVTAAPIPARLDRPTLERFLTGSSWTPQPGLSPPYGPGALTPIRFVRAAEVQRRPIAERTVLVRELERRNDVVYVAVDGFFYALVECRAGRVRSACLRHVTALPAEAVVPPHRFATPPP